MLCFTLSQTEAFGARFIGPDLEIGSKQNTRSSKS